MPIIPFKTTQKRSSVSGRYPELTGILDGEIFLQLADGGFLFKNAAGNDYVCAITNCTINGLNKIKFSGASNLDIPYWNGSCFVPTGLSNFVNKSETGNFVTTSQITGSGICINLTDYVQKSQTGLFVSTGQTGVFVLAANTGNFITTSQTGAFGGGGSIDTGNFVTTGQTGAFATTGHTHSNYVSTGSTGNFITIGQTGTFAASAHTHNNYVSTGSTGNFVTTGQTGVFATTGHTHSNYVSTGSTGNFVLSSNTGNFITNNQTIFASTTQLMSGTTTCSAILGGNNSCLISSCYSILLGGSNNFLDLSSSSAIIGSSLNVVSTSVNATILGGTSNYICSLSCNSSILAGSSNKIQNSCSSSILGGYLNCINAGGCSSDSILAGCNNCICQSDSSIILGGRYNKISGNNPTGICSSLIFGSFNTISGSGNHIVIIGNSITASTSNTVFVNNICACNGKFYGDGSGLFNLNTGCFITTGQTGAFGGGGSIDTGNFVTTGQTGDFAAAGHTHSNYVSTGSTGDFVTTGQTGAFAAAGHTHSNYVSTGSTGDFVTTGQTGIFITTGQTGAFGGGGSINTGDFVTTGQTGSFGGISSIQLTGYASGIYCSGYINVYFKQYPNIKIVGVDYPTIQSAIDSVTDADTCKNYSILIPPGKYVENLTLKPLVNLIGINGDLSNLGVLICGCHSYTPAYSNVLCNRITIDNVSFINPSGTPIFYINSSGYCSQIRFNGVYIEDNYTGINDTCSIYALSGATLYFNHSRLQTLNTNRGTALYLECATGVYLENQSCIVAGNRAIKMTGYVSSSVPYLQSINSFIEANTNISGSEVIRIDNGLAVFGSSSITNNSTSGNGIFISSGAVVGVYDSTFKIAAYGAGYYAVNGHTGTFGGNYFHTLNMYSCVAAAGLLYNTKYKSGMNIFAYPTGITAQA